MSSKSDDILRDFGPYVVLLELTFAFLSYGKQRERDVSAPIIFWVPGIE